MPDQNNHPRVLMLGWEDPNRIHGGLGVASAALADSLQGHTDVSFWFPSSRPSGAARPQRYQKAIPVHLPAYAAGKDLYGEAIQKAMTLYNRTVVEEGLNWDPDIVHAHDWMTFPAAGQIASSLGVPLVLHVHSLATDRSENPSGLPYETEQEWLKAAALIIAVSKYTARQLQEQYQISASRIAVLDHGAPPVEPFRTPSFTRQKLVLFVGRMTWQKGPEHFLSMAEHLLAERSDLRFVMAGDGDLWPELIKRVAKAGNGTTIHLPGHLDREAVFRLFSMADALVMTSESEPLGLVALEAAHFGVPVILPPNCGATDMLPDAPVVHPWQTKEVASTLTTLLDQPEETRSMVEKNREAIRDHSWEKVGRRLLSIYHERL